jgi:hypothetical protein
MQAIHIRNLPLRGMLLVVEEEQSDEAETGTVARVRRWLKDTGYQLKLRTAAAFRATGLTTEAARYYVARDSETLREIDVIATGWQAKPGADTAWLEVVHVVECKGANEHPWVAFQGDDRFVRDEDVLSTLRVDRRGGKFDNSTGEYSVNSLRIEGLHHTPLLYWTERLAYAITESGGKSGQAYNAVRQVLSAVDGYARDMVDDTTRPVVRVTVPIVVTAAPLVTCRLDDDGSSLLEEVERVLSSAACGLQRRWSASGLSATALSELLQTTRVRELTV